MIGGTSRGRTWARTPDPPADARAFAGRWTSPSTRWRERNSAVTTPAAPTLVTAIRQPKAAVRPHAPGAETIHEKARDRLADRRGRAPGRDQTTERGVGDAELDAEERKERGKDEAVEVAEEMAHADDGDDVGVGGGGRDSSG